MIYLSLMYEKEKEQEYLKSSKIGMQVADNILQWNILEGFSQNLTEETIHVINSIPMGNYPKYNRKICFKSSVYIEDSLEVTNVGFINLPLLKPIIRYFKYVKELKKYRRNSEKVNVVVYGLYLPQLLAIKKVKKRNKNLIVTIIIDDLPAQYGIVSGNPIARKIKNRVGHYIVRILNKPDFASCFVFLTEAMKDVIHTQHKKYTVVEGVATSKEEDPSEEILNPKNVIFYAGTLNYEFGIMNLLNAFREIKDESYELWICGEGEAKEDIKLRAQEDKRIRYFGFLSKDEVSKLQKQAKVLVNPRKNQGEYTKYSFPSKTIEYMLARKPVVMYKLDGIPDEYDKYIYYVAGEKDCDLKEAIERVCNMDCKKLEATAKAGCEWVLREKNACAQVKKIVDLWV